MTKSPLAAAIICCFILFADLPGFELISEESSGIMLYTDNSGAGTERCLVALPPGSRASVSGGGGFARIEGYSVIRRTDYCVLAYNSADDSLMPPGTARNIKVEFTRPFALNLPDAGSYRSAGIFINPAGAAVFAKKAVSHKSLSKPYSFSPVSAPGLKIFFKGRGMFRVRYSDISSFVSAADPRTFRLFNKDGVELPLYVSSSETDSFRSGDYFLFHGDILPGDSSYYNQYTHTNCYILKWGGRFGKRYVRTFAGRKADPFDISSSGRVKIATSCKDTLHLENDIVWRTAKAGIDVPDRNGACYLIRDEWFWETLSRRSHEIDLTIPSPYAADAANVIFRISMRGASIDESCPSCNNHEICFSVNGNDLMDSSGNCASWNGFDDFVFRSKPYAVNDLELTGGKNPLSIVSSSSEELELLNWVEVIYEKGLECYNNELYFNACPSDTSFLTEFRVTKITGNSYVWDLEGARKLEGYIAEDSSLIFQDSIYSNTEFLVHNSSGIKAPSSFSLMTDRNKITANEEADYIIISADRFYGGSRVEKLKNFRKSRGLKVREVSVSQIFDTFNSGIYSPFAVREFISYAYNNWKGSDGLPPEYLLIAGGAVNEYDIRNNTSAFVPTFLSYSQNFGLVADDSWFVTVSGNDPVPDMMVGRLPADNGSELSAMVDNIIYNGKSAPPGPWKKNILLTSGAENSLTFNERTNAFMNFTDVIQDMLRPGNTIDRVDSYDESRYYYSSFTDEKVRDYLNVGQRYCFYYGHGGGFGWMDENGLIILNADLVENIESGGKMPFVGSFTCFTGAFEWSPVYSANYSSLGEAFLKKRNDGCIGFWGAAGESEIELDAKIYSTMISLMPRTDTLSTGGLVLSVKAALHLEDDPAMNRLLYTYNLLGDPAVIMTPPSKLNTEIEKTSLSTSDEYAGFTISDSSAPGASYQASLYDGDSRISFVSGNLNSAGYAADSLPTGPDTIQQGFIRIYAGAESGEYYSVELFKKGILSSPVTNLEITPSLVYPGDSVRAVISVRPGYSDSILQSRVFFLPSDTIITANAVTEVPGYYSDLTYSPRDSVFKSEAVYLDPGDFGRNTDLYVSVRGSDASDPGLLWESGIFRTKVLPLPDYLFTADDYFSVISDSSGSAVLRLNLQNRGTGAGIRPSVKLYRGGTDTIVYSAASSSGDTVSPNRVFNVDMPWPDSLSRGVFMITAVIDPDSTVKETREDNNAFDTLTRLEINREYLASGDTLWSLDSGAAVSPLSASDSSIFSLIAKESFPGNFSEGQDSLYEGFQKKAWDFDVSAAGSEDGFKALVLFKADTDSLKSVLRSGKKAGVFFYDTSSGQWLWQGGEADSSSGTVSLQAGHFSVFAPGINSDSEPPSAEAYSAGTKLTSDYIPPGSPIDIFMYDNSGLLLDSVRISVNSSEVSGDDYSVSFNGQSRNKATASYYPGKTGILDSLRLFLTDINGNRDTSLYLYRMGEKFGLEFAAFHPNPFNTRGIIAYSLTDYAKTVKIDIYSMAGRKVVSFKNKGRIGYNEVVWDGKASNGEQVASGLYYLKLQADSGSDTIEKTIKIFRVRR
ncbi:MAG: C25 family cysteine peptidase [Fibrobacterota bacterium]